MAVPLEDYGLIGDLQTVALVSRQGSIDWLCVPRFDSGAIFASLLGADDNGHWTIQPEGTFRTPRRRYRGDTLVLETEFETPSGTARLVDFMPPRGEAPDVVRIVEGVQGSVDMRMELVIRFDYGSLVPWVRNLDGMLVGIAGPDAVSLRTPVELQGRNLRTFAEFRVGEGDRIPFVLTWFPSHSIDDHPAPVDAEVALKETVEYWEDWAGNSTMEGRWRDAVVRSLLTLKALTYAPTGGIVAAATTSLPEELGGVRNWDYRYCWLRDATLTLLAFLRAGYLDEARSWRDWLLRAIAGSPTDIQIMYGVAGERRLTEVELPWLAGYEGSRPVRIGNDASNQFQLDVYGELIDALYLARIKGIEASDDAWAMTSRVFDWLESSWREPDEGIWEVRGPRRHFTHSKVMAWVAFDRAVKAIEKLGRDGPVDSWRATRDADQGRRPRERLQPGRRRVRPVLRVGPAGREPAPHPARRLPPGEGRARRRNGGGDPARPDAGRLRRAVPRGRRERRRRRAPSGRGRLPAVLVLAGRGPRTARAARRGGRALRAAALAAERPRAPLGGVRPGERAARRQLPAGVHAPRARRDGVLAARRALRALAAT